MADPERYRTLAETEEFSAQYDHIVGRYSEDVVGPPLSGLLWGIAANPKAYQQVTWLIRRARSRSLGLTVPVFEILFSIENEGQESESVLLLWIQEVSATEDLLT